MHSKRSRTIAAILGAGVLGAGILGSVAMAATPATSTTATSASGMPGGVVLAEKRDPGRRAEFMARVLNGLVEKGVITKDQAEQILRAFAAAAENKGDRDRGDHAKRFLGGVMKTSAEYLGLTGEQLKEQLKSGKSLARIAAELPGKNRDGLIAALTSAAEAKIKEALDAGKITPQQAEEARTRATVAIVKIVDREPGERKSN